MWAYITYSSDFGDIVCTYALRMTESTIVVIFPKRVFFFFIDISILLYVLCFIKVIKYYVEIND